MIVFTGDWVKLSGCWKQVTDIDYGRDLFSVLDSDGERQWFGTEVPDVFEAHISNTEMQTRLQDAGI